MEDIKSYPINYNHYYTDNIKGRRQARNKESLAKCIEDATIITSTELDAAVEVDTSAEVENTSQWTANVDDVTHLLEKYRERSTSNMEMYTCDEALDCVFSMYKVC